jgi:transposase-like protein
MARSSTHAELPTPSPPPPGTERAKVLSVRLSADEFERLTDLATEIGVGPSTLARTLIRRGMAPTNTAVEAVTSPLEQAHLERTHVQSDQDTGNLGELTVRVAALEAWVASHPAHDAT